MSNVHLETPRLRLLAPSLDHLDELAPVFGDPRVMRYIGDGAIRDRDQVAAALDRAMDFHRRLGLAFWTVQRRDTGAIIGDCGLVPMARVGPEIELGYRLCADHWGLGFATEAAGAALAYAFTDRALPRVHAVTFPENHASRRVLAKLGLRELGLTGRYYGVTTVHFELGRAGWSLLVSSRHPDGEALHSR